MKEKFKPVLAVILGLCFAVLLIVISQMIGHFFYPIPDEFKHLDFSNSANQKQLEALMAAAPIGSLIIVLIGYMMAAFGGGMLTSFICKQQKVKLSLVLGTLLTIAGISNLMLLPHPIWFVLLNLPSFLLFTWLGSLMIRDSTKEPST